MWQLNIRLVGAYEVFEVNIYSMIGMIPFRI